MKRTQHDQQYGAEFARQLRPFYDKALGEGQTEKEFAHRLGVDRGGLQRYLRSNAMPSFRTIVLAYRQFGITIPYANIESTRLVAARSRTRGEATGLQMDLPLTIEAPQGAISVVIKKETAQRVRLQVRAVRLG